MSIPSHALLCILPLLCVSASPREAAAAAPALPDFADSATAKQISAKGGTASVITSARGPVLRVETRTGHDWPGATIALPTPLDLSAHGTLIIPFTNPGSGAVQVNCRIDSLPKNAPSSAAPLMRTTSVRLQAGETKEVRIPLIPHVEVPGLKATDFFGMRGVPFASKSSMHLGNITSVVFFLSKPQEAHAFEIGGMRLEGEARIADAVPEKVFPLIDGFGQFKHRDWPGKTHSLDELHARRDAEAKTLADTSRPASWNQFGGWKDGPQLDATGFFRTAKHDGKWHLVDPEGRLFFSLGIDGVGFGEATILDERRHWFEELPPDDPANRPFYMTWKVGMAKDHYFGKTVRAFNFHKHNVMRKYGDDWQRAFYERSAARLPAWGVNTLGSWSDPGLWALRKVPYVAFAKTSGPVIEGSAGYWGKFTDVFEPAFQESLRAQLRQKHIAATKDDPWCIGYFVDNELSWADETALSYATLTSPATQKAKQVFVADLRAKYDTIDALNAAWKTAHASWDALLAATTAPEFTAARTDLEAFGEKIAETYFGGVRAVLREFAPRQLYLGCRYFTGEMNPIVAKASAKHCDVVSFNLYTRTIAPLRGELAKAGDKPYLIGEFHFGALDRGLFHTGIVATEDQADRARAFKEYVTECLAHPNIVGCHWFQYQDSPTTGRVWDGENYQIGFTDVCDTPYAELIEASRATALEMYRLRTSR